MGVLLPESPSVGLPLAWSVCLMQFWGLGEWSA